MKNFPLYKHSMLAAFVAATLVCTPAFAAKKGKVAGDDGMSLMEMSDQLDGIDKQDFQSAIERANECTRARNFSCSEGELTKAAKAANSSQDKKVLASARQAVVNEKIKIAEEERRRQDEIRRRQEEEERLAKLEEEREERRERQRQQAEKEEREARAERNRAEAYQYLNNQINQTFADASRTMANMNKETSAAYAETNRRLAAQAEDRKRAREEAEERASQQRRDAERDQNARIASAEAQRERDRQAEREQEQRRQREEQAAADKRAREQEQARLQEERRQQEARAAADKRAEQKRQADYLAALKQGIRLRATKCMGGEGKYYVTGSKPNIKKEAECVDVFYQASCPGSVATSRGVLGNFIGMSGCLGDLKEITPKPDCPVDQVLLEVTDVQASCNHGW